MSHSSPSMSSWGTPQSSSTSWGGNSVYGDPLEHLEPRPPPRPLRRVGPSVLQRFSRQAQAELQRLAALDRADVQALGGPPLDAGARLTPLQVAMQRLLRAQAACQFEDAVLAAEEAARGAESGRTEQAAVAGARAAEAARIVDVMNETLPGTEPGQREVKVICYMGRTGPAAPKAPDVKDIRKPK